MVAYTAKQGGGVPAKRSKKREPLRLIQVAHLVRRLLIFICAVFYISVSFKSAYDAMGLLRGRDDPHLPFDVSTFDLITNFMGQATVRESRLITFGLENSTEPINGTLYLESFDHVSTAKCTNIPDIQAGIYEDGFIRSVYSAVADGTSYHVTELGGSNVELIAPVVDCTTSDIFDGDATSSRFFFLVRQRANHDNVSMVMVSLSNQQYKIPAQGENGPAGVATIQIINDMRYHKLDYHYIVSLGYPYEEFSFRVYAYVNTTDDGLWTLRSIPANDDEIEKTLQTACRDGFYIKAETEQSNINNQLWIVDTEPFAAMSRWRWIVKPDLHDSWAWIHGVQFLIGVSLLSNLAILCLATYRNIRAGKWWIGDAFVSISTSQIINGVAVLISWFMNEYWCLHEFSFSIGYTISDSTNIHIYTMPLRAELLTIYLSACGIIGTIFRERIDALFATFCFLIGFEFRIPILKGTSFVESISSFSEYSYMRGVSGSLEGQETISPMRFWTTYPIGVRNYGFVFKCLFPIYITLTGVIGYVICRKIYRFFYPEKLHVQRGNTGTKQSENEYAMLAQKRVLTLFEVATGAELENRYGLVSDYERCIFIKGMKFASADGIYSTGFIIANKKFLLQTSDYWTIVLMKVMRRRLRNIYVYDVNGSTVQQMARLVYPHTLSVTDLLNINVSILS